jgi:selenide,water dikinase
MPPRAVTTDLVLLGAGHAHVEVLRRQAMRPAAGLRMTLIAREPHTPYSGMLPGLIRGEYGFDEAHIDCARLAAAAGARLIFAEAEGLELAAGRVTLRGRPGVAYDLLSLDVGGTPAMPAGVAGIPVKPIGRFLARLRALEERLAAGARLAVIGGGAGGTELALALATRLRGRAAIALVAKGGVLPAAPPRARRIARAALATARVDVIEEAAVGGSSGLVLLADGRVIETAASFWATGAMAPPWLAASGLACDPQGCVRVARTLRSVSHARVFAAGDCASVEGAPRPKSGVWAVRAGAPLSANLVRAAAGRPLRPWRPQRVALAILGLGDGRGLAWRGRFTVSGRLAMRWKDRIDRRWMAMYQRLAPMAAEVPMRCGGCGAKVGAAALGEVLRGLAVPARPDILIGLAAPDDAALVQPPAGMAVVQSVDHFRAFLDDPFLFGEIAATHALGDLHAMGATPWTALAIAALPAMPGRKTEEDLAAMMQGAARVLAAEGCALVGGHSGEAPEASLGFAVTGLVDPAQAWRKAGLRPGEALVLTKALGTGLVLAAQMQGRARARWLEPAINSMRLSNSAAVPILRAHGVTACTDITGFGLAGHLGEMLRASSVGAAIDPAALPALPGARELAAAGVESTLAPANRAASGIAEPLLIDPQTSGGLLAGVAAARAADCVRALHDAGFAAAAVIGHVTAEPGLRLAKETAPCATTASPPSLPTASARR